MDAIMLIWIIPMAGIVGGAIGWLVRQFQYHREAKRQAARETGDTLKDKKTLLEEMISKTEETRSKQTLLRQLDEVNAALLGLYGKRLRHTLKEAGLPTEETLIADGRTQLQPQQVDQLKGEIAELQTLPQSDSILDLLALGNAYYYAEQYEDAKDIYDRILNLNPNDPSILMSRGVAYGQLGRYDEALADFNRSLELRPDDPGTLTNRGNAYMELGRYNEALADLNHSLELSPDDPTTLHNLGCLYERLGRYDEAFADFNRSLELSPDDPVTLYDLACLCSLQRKTDDALTYLERAIDADNKYREDAKTDKDFDNIRSDPRFKKITEPD
ncbi:tetratricopeptide repeat protein [Chloroflexota bacterium]